MRALLCLLLSVCFVLTAFAQSATVYDINPGFYGSYPSFFTPFKGRLYFVALDSVHGSELRSLDSNTAPRLEFELEPGRLDGALGNATGYISVYGVTGGGGELPRHMAVTHSGEGKENALYFYGDNKPARPGWQTYYYTLFKYDGLTTPIPVITDFNNDKIAGRTELTAIGDKVYFTVQNINKGNIDLYEYNERLGTYSIVYSTYKSKTRNLVPFKGKLIFSDNLEMHEFDPVSRQEKQITFPPTGGNYVWLTYPKVIGDKLYFADEKGDVNTYDGTTIQKVASGYCWELNSFADLTMSNNQYFGEFRNKVYFPCYSGSNCIMCEYDPATGNTQQFTKITKPRSFVIAQNKLFFNAYDDAHGYELWSYSGSGSPTIAYDVVPGKSSGCAWTVISFKDDIYFIGPGSKFFPFMLDWELLKYIPGKPNSNDIANTVASQYNIKLYPDPATNACNISIDIDEPQTLQVNVYNNLGQVALTLPSKTYNAGNNIITLQLDGLIPGIYNVMLSGTNTGTITAGRLVKQ